MIQISWETISGPPWFIVLVFLAVLMAGVVGGEILARISKRYKWAEKVERWNEKNRR